MSDTVFHQVVIIEGRNICLSAIKPITSVLFHRFQEMYKTINTYISQYSFSFFQVLAERATFKKSAIHLLWLSLEQFAKLLSVFIMSVFLARLLGPTQYGYYTYIFAFVSIFIPLASAGLPTLAIREFSQSTTGKGKIFGTMLFLQIVVGVVTFLLAVSTMVFIRTQDSTSQLLVGVLMFALALQSGELVESWFQSKLELHKLIPLKTTFLMFFLVCKIVVLYLNRSVEAIITLTAIEIILTTILMYGYFFFSKQITSIHIDFEYLKKVIKMSFPIVISGFAVMVYAKADFLFLQYYLGSNVVAQYAVALGITEVLALFPSLLLKAATPALLHAGRFEKELFSHHITNIYRLMFLGFIIMVLVSFFISIPLIPLIYGSQYNVAMGMILLLSLRLFFTNFGIARSLVVTNGSIFYFDLFTNVIGAILNVAGNILLIPIWGWQGAVISSLFALFISTFVMDYFHPVLRKNLFLEMKAIISPHQFRL